MNQILQIGTILRERYTITDVLSSNTGFGITYKVRDSNHPNQPIRILKQLKKPTTSKLNIESLPILQQEEILKHYWQEYLRLFRIETQALAKLGEEYKQIPTIFESFDEQDEYFYVQEYIEGHALSEQIKEHHQLSEQKTIALLIEILEVLEYIQTNPGYSVIHRDIKPENIIRRDKDQKLVLIDFGLAKEVTVSGIKVGSIAGGTTGYIAPEIILGIVCFASDIYAVGMIGVFAITGKDPSHTLSLAETWQTEVNVSQEFAAVLNKMIAESYKQRFQKATEALKALKKLENKLQKKSNIKPVLFSNLPIKLIIKLTLATVVIIGAIFLGQQSDSQLIPDGQEKPGELTTSDKKELSSGKFFDNYKFKSDKQQYLIVEVVSNDFNPLLSIRKLDEENFTSVKNVAGRNNTFRVSIIVEKGEYELKITSESVALGNYTIQAWVNDI